MLKTILRNYCSYIIIAVACLCIGGIIGYTTYTMTAAEMSALDSRLNLLLEQTKATKQALAESQAALSESKTELSKLKTESIKLQIELQAQSSLLESANNSLQASAREEKRVKKQRLLWQIIAGSVVVVLVKEKQ